MVMPTAQPVMVAAMTSDVLTVTVVVVPMIHMLTRDGNAVTAMARALSAQIHVAIVVAREPFFVIPAVEQAIYLRTTADLAEERKKLSVKSAMERVKLVKPVAVTSVMAQGGKAA